MIQEHSLLLDLCLDNNTSKKGNLPSVSVSIVNLMLGWHLFPMAFVLVSYDVTSLFTNIPLSETIDLAVNAIIDGNMNPDLKLSKVHLKQLFNFATSHTHFLFNGCFYD